MPLNKDRNTPYMDGELIPVPVVPNAVFHAGSIVVADASGYALPGKTATGLTYLGCADAAVNNVGGGAGAKTVYVRRKKAFKFKNYGTDPVTQASLGKVCYIVDDETVAATDGTGTRSAAGKVIGLDSAGVWVE